MNHVISVGSLGEVVFVNAELVSQKAIASFCKLMEHTFVENDAVVLNAVHLLGEDLLMTGAFPGKGEDRVPAKSVMGMGYPELGAIAISLPETFGESFGLLDDFPNVSLYPVYWHNLLLTLTHELVHLGQMAEHDNPKAWLDLMLTDKSFRNQMEADAKSTSLELLDDYCQTYDSEPPAWGEEKFFAANIVTLYGTEDGENAKEIGWLNDRVFVEVDIDGEPHPIQDFRSYMALNSENPEDKVWAKDLLPVLPEVAPVANGFQETIKETTVPDTSTADFDPDVPEGSHAVESDLADVMFGGASMMAGASPMPSIPTPQGAPVAPASPTFAPQAAPQVAPAPGPAIANEVAGGFGFGPQGGAQQSAPAGQVYAATQTQPVVEVYPNHGLDPVAIRETWYSVATKCFNHVFTHCQPQGGGQPHENIIGFLKADAVATIPVMLTEQEKMVVVKCECINAMGQRREGKATADGEVRGWVTPEAKVPMYKLTLNANGQEIIRTLVPQNPNKRNAAGLTNPASLARQGTAIMYVFEGNDILKQANPSAALKAKCTNGQWQVINA